MLSTFPREFSPENILVPATKHLRLRTTDEPGKNVIAANITELVIRILHKIGRRGQVEQILEERELFLDLMQAFHGHQLAQLESNVWILSKGPLIRNQIPYLNSYSRPGSTTSTFAPKRARNPSARAFNAALSPWTRKIRESRFFASQASFSGASPCPEKQLKT